MEHIKALIILSLFILSCEKDSSEPEPAPLETYLMTYSGYIYQYSTGADTFQLDPMIKLRFNANTNNYHGGYFDDSHYFNWEYRDTIIYINGDFLDNLPGVITGGYFENFIRLGYHPENVTQEIKIDTFTHKSTVLNTYYLTTE